MERKAWEVLGWAALGWAALGWAGLGWAWETWGFTGYPACVPPPDDLFELFFSVTAQRDCVREMMDF